MQSITQQPGGDGANHGPRDRFCLSRPPSFSFEDMTTSMKARNVSLALAAATAIVGGACDFWSPTGPHRRSWVFSDRDLRPEVCAWHPWKHSLICYVVAASNFHRVQRDSRDKCSWIVLANACNGKVLKRIEQTSCYSNCPTVQILSVFTHSLTFSRLTGELLMSATTEYRVKKKHNLSTSIIRRYSVVVMSTLDRIVETLFSSNDREKGFFFTWNSNGTKIALMCSDESLRVWNFWPTATIQKKSSDQPLQDSVQSRNLSIQSEEVYTGGNAGNSNTTLDGNTHINSNYYNYQGNHFPAMISELSFDASRVIK